MKDIIRSIRHWAENGGKATYELLAATKRIKDLMVAEKELSEQQCSLSLLRVVCENQKELAEIMKGMAVVGVPASAGVLLLL